MRFRGMHLVLAVVLLFFMEFTGSPRAQIGHPGQGGRRMNQTQMRMDPVERLNKALESAGSGPLSDRQDQELTTLVNNYRAAHQRPEADPGLRDVKRALEEAILSGSDEQIDRAANAVADQVTTRTRTMIRDLARFQMQVLSLLTEEQVSSLRTQYGNSGLIHMLGSLAGWDLHGGMGGGQGGWRQ